MFPSFRISGGSASRTATLVLISTLAACGGGGHHDGPAAPPPSGNTGPDYDLIQIGLPGSPSGEVTRWGIANGGIVAGTSHGTDGVDHAFLFDGSTSIPLEHSSAGSVGWAVNRCGHVAGWLGSGELTPRHAFLYDGSLRDVALVPDGSPSQSYGISNCGKVTGLSIIDNGQVHAFLYEGGTSTDLGSLGGNSWGVAVNTVGQVAGSSRGPGDAWTHAFLYDGRSGKPMQDLGSPGDDSTAVDLNDAGQVTGWWRKGSDLAARAFLYEAGKIRDIGTLGGPQAIPEAINAAGWVTGNSALADGSARGFVYDGATMISIGTLAGGNASVAKAINASGLVVGSAATASGDHAIAWTKQGGIVDLNTRVTLPAGAVLTQALAVADDGNIVVKTNTGLALLRLRQ